MKDKHQLGYLSVYGEQKSFLMILRLEIISSVVYDESKTLFFIKRIKNLPKIIIVIMFFVIENFVQSWPISLGKIFSSSLLFPILEV